MIPWTAPITAAELTAQMSQDAGGLTVRLAGTADLRVTDTIERLLQNVHEQVVANKLREVRVDLRELEFMNSSCFKSFVSWITGAQELAPERQYRIRFLSSPSILWQRRSLHALSCFAADLITIENGN